MLSKKFVSYVSLFLVTVLALVMLFSTMVLEATAVTVTGVSGVEVTVDSNGSISESGGTVTATVKGSFTTRKTTTITVKNTSGSTATISFDYTVSNHDSSVSTIDDLAGGNSGSYSVLLTAGATKTFTMCSNRFTSNVTATAKLSNFRVEAAAASSNVTVTYGGLGSVKIDGTTVTSGSVNSVSSASGASFVAVPGSGSKFVAWINPATNEVISTSATYQLIPAENMAIRAVFANASAAPVFFADGTAKVFEGLDAALNYVSSASNKTITLASDATLAAGNYTIPTGITMLIPFNAANTLYTTKPGNAQDMNEDDDAYATPSIYRTLNMASGAKITVNGAISLSACHGTKGGYNGAISGPYGHIKMAVGSSITVNSSANLYVWGLISGQGEVLVKSGGKVYQDFQITDWRGGQGTEKMKDTSYKVFPLSQYYFQNIEVPLTLESGAVEYGACSVSITLVGVQTIVVPLVGGENEGLFRLTKGTLTQDYDETTDRMILTLQGEVSISEISITLKVSALASATIKSSQYVMPITNNITIVLKDGSSINLTNDFAMLPGSRLEIENGATVTLAEGKSLYIYDADNWGGYTGSQNTDFIPIVYSSVCTSAKPIRKSLTDASIHVVGTLDATKGYIYSTNAAAQITGAEGGEIKLVLGTATETYQATQRGEPGLLGTTYYIDYHSIPIIPVKLMHNNGTYLQTGTATYVYDAECGHWSEGVGHTKDSFLVSNVYLGNNLDFYFAFKHEGAGDGWKVVINSADTRVEIPSDQWEYDKSIQGYVVIFNGLAAKQMTDTISVTLYNADGEAVDAWCDSVRDYAHRLLTNYANDTNKSKLRTLLVDMLNYGAACQTHFNYNEGDLANSKLDDTQKGYGTQGDFDWSDNLSDPTKDSNGNTNPYFDGVNLVTDGNIQFAIKFKGSFKSFTYSFANHWNDEDSKDSNLNKGPAINVTVDYDSSANYYYISDLVVGDARQVITFTVGDVTWTDSIEAYCYRMYHRDGATAAENAVFEAFMKFADAAEAYLEGGNRV